jgi:cyanate permease
MNKPQKFCVLLWIMATLAEGGLMYVVTDTAWKWTYLAGYGVVSLFLLGMSWVFADKKK